MKIVLPSLMSALMLSTAASAATLIAPDQDFIDTTAQFGISQENWDLGANAKITLQNAYKYTYAMEMSAGDKPVHDLGAAKGLDLKAVTALDLDGEYDIETFARDRMSLTSLVVLKDGDLVDEFYWNGHDKDRTHLQMSQTKSFTAMTVGILADKGLLDKNELISVYLPELKGSGFGDATVQEVSDMRSGIQIDFTPGKLWDERMTNVQQWNGVNKYPELTSVLDFGATLGQSTKYETGKVYDYQCANTEMLTMLIERVTGKNAADVIEEELWQQVGFEGKAVIMSNENGEIVGSGGLNTTTRNMARMMHVLVNGGKNHLGEQVVPADFVEALYAGDEEVVEAWSHSKEAPMADGWYKDQIRVLDLGGHKVFAFVGIHGQATFGDPETGVVVAMNGGQPEMQAPRTVMATFHSMVPALIDAAAKG